MRRSRLGPWVPVFLCWCLLVSGGSSSAQDWRAEGPFGGSVTDIAFDPATPDTVYAATSGAGVYRSDDGGRSWTLPGDEMTSRKVQWVEVDPSTAGTVWAGVENPGKPAMWRSRDRGATWQLVDGPNKGLMPIMHPVGYRIAFAPSRPADVWVPSTNMHYRSRDGGKTWTDFNLPGQDVYSIVVDPANPAVIWAGGHGGEQSHLSVSEDGGKTWRGAGAGLEPPVKLLATSRTEPSTLFASNERALFVSRDRGRTFTKVTLPSTSARDITRLLVDPTGAVWVASSAGLYRSTDGGQQWSRMDRGTGRFLGRGVAVHPRNPKVAFVATGGEGIYRSEDGGSTWAVANTGLAGTWVKQLHARPGSSHVFASTGAGYFRRDGNAWAQLGAPLEDSDGDVELDGMLLDRAAPDGVWAFRTASAWRSADGGRAWVPLDLKKFARRVDGPGFKSLAQDPGAPATLWAGAWSPNSPEDAVYKSTDGGRDWKKSGKGLPAESVTRLVASGPGQVLAVSKRESLYASRDGGATWTRAGTGLPDEDIDAIVADPSQPARVYVATEKGLFRSADGGATFAKVDTGEGDTVYDCVVAPDGRVFVGKFEGVFVSADAGATWTELSKGLANVDARAIAIGGAAGQMRLYVGFAGASVWSRPLP